MLPVYCKHFGLIGEPFRITADPTFLYFSDGHEEALAQLVYGIRSRRGFIVLTGEVGTGKTTLVQRLLAEINGTTNTAYVFNMIVSPTDLFRYVCEKFGIIGSLESRQEIHDYVSLLERFLQESNENGKNVALIIDEAQNLSTAVLENLRLLSNYETAREKLLQILLVGQPELAARLNAPELRQIKQRVALRYDLQPLNSVESKTYISKRLEIAGGSLCLFTTDALMTVYNYSKGIPRIINVLCDNGLLAAYASRQSVVDCGMIDEIAQSLNLTAAQQHFKLTNSNVLRDTNGGDGLNRKIELQHSVQLGSTDLAERVVERKQVDSLRINDSDPKRMRAASNAAKRQKTEVSPNFQSDQNLVPTLFFEKMARALTEVMGPMALIVVRDHVAGMGESETAFPKARLEELVERASKEVLVEAFRRDFQQVMRTEIRRIETSH